MKYLSVLVFAVFLSSTWYIINSEAAIPLETHIGIQEKIGQLIFDTIKAKKPGAEDIQIQQLWTEPFGPGKPIRVKAHYSYRFTEPSSEGKINTQIEGESILEKQPDDDSGFDRWKLTAIKTNNDAVSFEQALVITTGGGDQPEAPITEPTDPTQTQHE